jgi:hypothetical protein
MRYQFFKESGRAKNFALGLLAGVTEKVVLILKQWYNK